MGDRNDDLWEDLRAYNTSYEQHSDKIRSNFEDRTMQFAIRGWINDCRHFATKSTETALKLLERGGRLVKTEKDHMVIQRGLTATDVEEMLDVKMQWLDIMQKKNDSRR